MSLSFIPLEKRFIDLILFKEFKKFLSNHQKSLNINNSWEELGPYIEEVTGHYAVGLGRVEAFILTP